MAATATGYSYDHSLVTCESQKELKKKIRRQESNQGKKSVFIDSTRQETLFYPQSKQGNSRV